jgi:hypothetical protein
MIRLTLLAAFVISSTFLLAQTDSTQFFCKKAWLKNRMAAAWKASKILKRL